MLSDPSTSIVGLTVEDDIAFGPQCMGLSAQDIRKRLSESLDLFRLRGYEKRVTHTLSGGESQSTCIASVYAMKPKVFALDEPLSMIDPLGRTEVISAICRLSEELKATVLISESGDTIEYVAPICRRLIVLDNGEKIAEGPTREILGNKELLDRVHMRPPQVTELAQNLRLAQEGPPMTVEEGVSLIRQSVRLDRLVTAKTTTAPTSGQKQTRIVEVKNLHHVFQGFRPVSALKGINLEICKGEMIGLIGQNGSGKTTLALHLVGIYKPTNPEARVVVDGLEISSKTTTLLDVVKHINYVFQNPDNQLFCDTVQEEVAYALKILGTPQKVIDQKVKAILKLYELQENAEEPIMYLRKDKKTFLAQASVLVMDPKVLIVDEPTTGLDHERGERVMAILSELNQEQGKTIIVISHNMNLIAKYTKRAIVMSNGQIMLDGPTSEVFTKTDVLRQCSISPPQITRLGQSLGLRPDILTVEEMSGLLRGAMEGNPQ